MRAVIVSHLWPEASRASTVMLVSPVTQEVQRENMSGVSKETKLGQGVWSSTLSKGQTSILFGENY